MNNHTIITAPGRHRPPAGHCGPAIVPNSGQPYAASCPRLEGTDMFTVSAGATVAVQRIVTRPGVPRGAGVRLVADSTRSSLHIAVSPNPQPGDTVYEVGEGAQIFVAESAEELLRDRTIDALSDERGRVRFILLAPG